MREVDPLRGPSLPEGHGELSHRMKANSGIKTIEEEIFPWR
jgi:hypothetical protein